MNPNSADVNSASLPIDKRDASSEQHDAPDTMDDNVQHTIISTENDRKNRKEMDSASIVFASCITRDMTDIIQAFATQSLVQFQMFKQIWKQKRMSAAFHVEFWDSNPTQIHETILCSALNLLVNNVLKEKNREHAAYVIGSIFALYCTYSVQLSDPKFKIAVNPMTWMALSLVQSRLVDSDSTEEFFPRASVQVEAIMRKLFAENAFVKCLRGYTQGKNTRSKCQETIVSLKMLHLQNAPIQAAHHIDVSEFSHLDAIDSNYTLLRDAIPPTRVAKSLQGLKDQRRALVSSLQQQLQSIRRYNEEGLPSSTISVEEKMSSTKCMEVCSSVKAKYMRKEVHVRCKNEEIAMEIGHSSIRSNACTDALLELEEELKAFTHEEILNADQTEDSQTQAKSRKRSRVFSEGKQLEKVSDIYRDGLDALTAELKKDVLDTHESAHRLESDSRLELTYPVVNNQEAPMPISFASCEALNELERELQADVYTQSPHSLNVVDTASFRVAPKRNSERKKTIGKFKTQIQKTSRRRLNTNSKDLPSSQNASKRSTLSTRQKTHDGSAKVEEKRTYDANMSSREVHICNKVSPIAIVQANDPSTAKEIEDNDGLAELEAELAL
ncbi:hypothetical protein ABG067_002392 [Albugo candida]